MKKVRLFIKIELEEIKAIIVVPTLSSYVPGNICKANAKEFLKNAKYVNLKTDNNENKDESSYFKRTIQGKEIVFEIHDTVANFTKSDWKKVVAVFVSGNDYEFKDWPKHENIVTILLKVKGFYLKYSDLNLPKNIEKWNITKLEIHRTKRHLDNSIQNEFWNKLEEFLLLPRYRDAKFAK